MWKIEGCQAPNTSPIGRERFTYTIENPSRRFLGRKKIFEGDEDMLDVAICNGEGEVLSACFGSSIEFSAVVGTHSIWPFSIKDKTGVLKKELLSYLLCPFIIRPTHCTALWARCLLDDTTYCISIAPRNSFSPP